MVRRTATWCGVFAVAVASGAFAADRIDGVAPVVKRTPAEVAVGGLTPAEFMDQQRALHNWLVTQEPAGLENAVVNVSITDQDRNSVATPVVNGEPSPMRVGLVKPIQERVGLRRGQEIGRTAKASGSTIQQDDDGGFVWATTVTSPGAVAIRVHFEDFALPDNAEVYFYSPEGEAYGPYVGAGPRSDGEFWSNSVTSSTGVVMLKYYGTPKAEDLAGLSLRITEVAHVMLDFPRPAGSDGSIASFCTYNAACIENATCGSTGPAAAAENAVAKMRWISGPYVYICTGGLIADTDASSQIPYFLTANHCMSRSKDAKSLEAYFQYQVSCGTSNCVGSFNPAPSPSTMGASVVATGRAGDFTLLQLDTAPPSGSTFLGWNNTPIANSNGAALHRISHPSGAPQAYSRHAVDTGAGTCTGWPRGERIYSSDISGATEGGSSGSPVVNAAGEVVGQLSGCCGYNCANECDTASNSTVDGAFAYYWSSVAPYLDPQGGGNPVCGDGTCDSGEDACTCPADCGGACCGNGTCESGEDSCNCQADCGGTCSCGGNRAACNTNADCCSGSCKGGSCKGN